MEPVLLLPVDGCRWIEPFLQAQERGGIGKRQEAGAVGELHEVNLDFGVHGRASAEVKSGKGILLSGSILCEHETVRSERGEIVGVRRRHACAEAERNGSDETIRQRP